MKNRNISIIILCKTLKVMFWCISISFHLYEQFTFCNMVASERWYFHWYFIYCDINIHEGTVAMRARLCWTPLWSWSSGSSAYTYLSAVRAFESYSSLWTCVLDTNKYISYTGLNAYFSVGVMQREGETLAFYFFRM